MTCVIFDADFDSYLIDHALASKSFSEQFGQMKPQLLEKTGFIEEDVRNLLRIALNLELNNQAFVHHMKNKHSFQ